MALKDIYGDSSYPMTEMWDMAGGIIAHLHMGSHKPKMYYMNFGLWHNDSSK